MKKVFIIHGFMARPDSNWSPVLRDRLVSLGHEVHLLEMPNPNFPKKKKWLNKIRESVGVPDENTILIGHSLGGTSTLLYLESFSENQKLDKAFIVSGPYKKAFTLSLEVILDFFITGNFFYKKIDFQKIKNRANKFIVIFGSDDPVVPPKQGREIAKNLGVESIVIDGGGHFCEDSGKEKYGELIEKIVSLI